MLILPVPIHVPSTVKNIDIKNTVHNVSTIIWALKLSSLAIIFDFIHEAGWCVNKTKITTHTHISGIDLNVFAQTLKLNPISKQVINGAIIFTDIIDIIAKNKANSFLLRGNFM